MKKKTFFAYLVERLDRCREWLAYKIHPETGRNAIKYKLVLTDLRDIQQFVGSEIPEVEQAAEWVLGKNWERLNHEPAQTLRPASPYNCFLNYPSLVQFRNAMIHDYKKKISC